MGWEQGIRDLTKEEEDLIRDFLAKKFSVFGEHQQAAVDHYMKKILADDWLKMDFLEFAQKGTIMGAEAIKYYIVTD